MEGNLKVYECEECSYSTEYAHYLERHTRTHLSKVNKSNNLLRDSVKITSAVGKHNSVMTTFAVKKQKLGHVKKAQDTNMFAEHKEFVWADDSVTDSKNDSIKNCKTGTRPAKKVGGDLNEEPVIYSLNDQPGCQYQQRVYHCHLCQYDNKSEMALKNHIKVKHFEEAFYSCKEYEKKTSISESNNTKNKGLEKRSAKAVERDLFKFIVHSSEELPSSGCHLKVYHCHLCEYKNTSLQTVKNHIKVKHLGEALYSCTECDIQFFARKQYYNHRVRFHPSQVRKRPFPVKKEHAKILSCCPDCSFTAAAQSDFNVHRAIHVVSKGELFTCNVCLIDFKTQNGLKTHYGMSHRKGEPLTCDLCSKTFGTNGELEAHIQRHTRDFKFCCDKCEKGFVSKRRLKDHHNACNGLACIIKMHNCSYCSFSTKYKGVLKDHKYDHRSKEPPYKKEHANILSVKISSAFQNQDPVDAEIAQDTNILAECKGFVSSDDSTTDSESDQTGNDEAREGSTKKVRCDLKKKDIPVLQFQDGVYHCHLCPYKNTSTITVKDHIKVKHLGEALFSCTECDIQFFARKQYYKHRARFHPSQVRKRPFPVKKVLANILLCPDCSFTAAAQYDFNVHRAIHVVSKGELFTCNVCLIDFKTQIGLKVHYGKSHRKGEPLTCDLCSKTFNRYRDLEEHIQRHTKDYKCVCDKCEKGFVSKRRLKDHHNACYGLAYTIKMHNCSYCSFSTKYKGVLKDHEYQHGSKEPPYKCELTNCEYTTFYRWQLKYHERSRHGIVGVSNQKL